MRRLWERSAEAAFAPLIDQPGWEFPAFRGEQVRAVVEDPGIGSVLEEDDGGRLLGYSIFGTNRDEDPQPGTGEIRTFFVDPDTWGQGVGKRLIAATLDGLRELGYQRAMLWSFDGNERANRFYERHGFRRDGAERRDPDVWADALIVRYSRAL
jgi:RimJ/RimL family protein N-acetyltransferase